MDNYGFIRVAAAVSGIRVADTGFNSQSIEAMVNQAHKDGVSLISFPELAVTGSTCGDLFGQRTLLNAAKKAVLAIAEATKGIPMLIFIGALQGIAVLLPMAFALLVGAAVFLLIALENKILR